MSNFNSKYSSHLPPTSTAVHKYTRGRVAVVAGSEEYPGAAMLASRAAARAGGGYINLFTSSEIIKMCQSALPSIVVRPIQENCLDEIAKANCIVAGPGMGLGADRVEVLRKLLKIEKPLIVDADLIKLIPKLTTDDLFKRRVAPLIITPHRGELRGLLFDDCNKIDLDLDKNINDCSLNEISEMTQRWLAQANTNNTIVVAKGEKTAVVTNTCSLTPNGGSDALATAGSGDVLAGLMGGMIAQCNLEVSGNKNTLDEVAGVCAACVEVHALSGELAANRFGRRGPVACDIADCIGHATDELYRATK